MNAEYKVKAAIYHLHPPDAAASLNCGHFVTYVKQDLCWHLANDSHVLSETLPKSKVAIRKPGGASNLWRMVPSPLGCGICRFSSAAALYV